MPTDQPSNAPEAIGNDARDGDTAAAVLSDPAPELNPGGGGMRGPAAAAARAGDAGSTGASRNSPVDTGIASPDEDASTAAEARTQSVQASASVPRPSSQ